MHFYLNIYLFFFKEIHAKGKRDRHGNHVLAAKHRKIIWHDLIFFLCKMTTYTTTKIHLPHKDTI